MCNSLLNFWINITPWAFLDGSGFKLIFHWYVQLLILPKSSFKSIYDKLRSRITESREVSSAKSFRLDFRSLDTSVTHTRKKRDRRIDPWETSALKSLQDECWLFKTTCCFVDFKISFKRRSNLSEMSFFWSLNIRPVCHTLSSALEISKNTLWNSKPSSKDLYISCAIERSWLMQESPPLKPNWCDDIKLLPIRYGYNSLDIECSNILPQIASCETGL